MGGRKIERAVLIAGPTASGKSALALKLANEMNGVIVNADSMQVYGTLRVLTARPDDDALAQAPHELYGHVDPSIAYSVGAWLTDVERLAAVGTFQGRTPIFVGGTGLYFSALTQGLSEIPVVPPGVRELWRSRLAEQGPGALHQQLNKRDPEMAARLKASDGQRIVRALEVLDGTGQPLTYWQDRRTAPLVDLDTARPIIIDPVRAELRARIDARFDRMIKAGALDEVEALRRLKLDAALPVMKAIGVRELSEALDGLMPLAKSTSLAKTATGQYAKRQQTWFRRQFDARWQRRTELL